MNKDAIPELEGWITTTDAAGILGVSKQAIHKMIDAGKISTSRKIGKKPLYVMREEEISKIHEDKEAAALRAATAPGPVTPTSEAYRGRRR